MFKNKKDMPMTKSFTEFILPLPDVHLPLPRGKHQSVLHGQTLVAHAYNPSYSRGRYQEDHGSKPAQANS
jgi:hypothetical protein